MMNDSFSISRDAGGQLGTAGENAVVSVIIPVYDVEAYLRACLDSVLMQSYRQLEVILLDDGSPDNSGAICDEYAEKDPRFRVIHKPNTGVGNTRNIGIDAASGKWIIFLDSDDMWVPDTIMKCVREAEKNDLQLLVFAAEPFWEGMDKPEGDYPYQHAAQNGIVKNGVDSIDFAQRHDEYYTSPCLRFYRLDYLRENGFRFDEGIRHEDESFSFLSCLAADRVEYIGDQLYRRRFHPGSFMSSKTIRASAHDFGVILDRLLDEFRERERAEKEKEVFARQLQIYVNVIRGLYGQAADLPDREIAREIRKDVSGALKKARVLAPYLTRRERLSTYSLPAGYRLPKAFTRLKHIFRQQSGNKTL